MCYILLKIENPGILTCDLILKTALPKNDDLKCLLLRVYFWYSLRQRQSRKAIATFTRILQITRIPGSVSDRDKAERLLRLAHHNHRLVRNDCLESQTETKPKGYCDPRSPGRSPAGGCRWSQTETKPKGYCDTLRRFLHPLGTLSQTETKPKGYCDGTTARLMKLAGNLSLRQRQSRKAIATAFFDFKE